MIYSILVSLIASQYGGRLYFDDILLGSGEGLSIGGLNVWFSPSFLRCTIVRGNQERNEKNSNQHFVLDVTRDAYSRPDPAHGTKGSSLIWTFDCVHLFNQVGIHRSVSLGSLRRWHP